MMRFLENCVLLNLAFYKGLRLAWSSRGVKRAEPLAASKRVRKVLSIRQ